MCEGCESHVFAQHLWGSDGDMSPFMVKSEEFSDI